MTRALACCALFIFSSCALSENYHRFSVGEPDGGEDGGFDGGGDGGEDGGLDCDRDDTVFVSATGDDQNPGTREAPLATIAAAMAKVAADDALTRVHVGAGTFGTTYESADEIDLADGVTLRGGFGEDLCTYDPAAHVTIIEQRFGEGGDVDPQTGPIAAIQGDDLAAGVTLEGFSVSIGAETDDDHVGIRLRNTSAVIRDVRVVEGDGRAMTGLFVSGGASLTLERVTVAMDNASHNLTGVQLVNVGEALVRELVVERTVSTNGLPSMGLAVSYSAIGPDYALTVERSRIHGGRSTSSARAISVEDGRGGGTAVHVSIVDNLLHGGEGDGQTFGIYMSGSSRNTDVFHNAIYAGEGGGFGYGVQYQYVGAGADIRNNVIFAMPDSQHFCVYRTSSGEGWSGSDETLSNNLFFDCTFALLYDGVGDLVKDAATLNSLTSADANQVAAASPFTNLAGPDLLVGTMANNDWSLADGSPCSYTDGAFALASVSEDYFGAPRDDTPSIGAIEFQGTCTP